MPKVSKPCPICGQPIVAWPFVIDKRKTCSNRCRGVLFARSENYKKVIKTRVNPLSSHAVIVTCLHCKKEYSVGAHRAKNGAKFCSNACKFAHAKAGNRKIYYLRMTAPDGRRVQIHRHLMECKLGR